MRVVRLSAAAFLVLLLRSAPAAAIPRAAASTNQQVLRELVLQGASVYSREDVLWLLHLREGAALQETPDEVAKALRDRYARDGYTEARVTAAFDNGRLTLEVDEGRIDDIELVGLGGREADRFRNRLPVRAGDIYNKRTIGQAVGRLVAGSGGAIEVGRPRPEQIAESARREAIPDDVVLEHRSGRNVLVIPLRWRYSHTDVTTGGTDRREDLYSPVDAFAPSVGFSTTIFDHTDFNHTLVDGYVSYKFGRDDAGYSFGLERPIFRGPRLVLGAELHEITATDDLWRLSTSEQTLVALGFKNSFRDYYRRRGTQIFGVLRPGDNNELSLMFRWDRHEALPNTTDFSFFRDAAFRTNPLVADGHVNAVVVGYRFDTRPLTGAGDRTTYTRHLMDDLFGFGAAQEPGLRVEWTSEIVGHGLGGDARFSRHIANTRGYLALSPRQRLSGRALFGFSTGTVPLERRFALGGIGSVHGYRFKQESGTGMVLLNAEYHLDLTPRRSNGNAALSVFAFYDGGRVSGAEELEPHKWLQGVGVGVGTGGIRIEFGFRADAIPRSRQILVRFGPTF